LNITSIIKKIKEVFSEIGIYLFLAVVVFCINRGLLNEE